MWKLYQSDMKKLTLKTFSSISASLVSYPSPFYNLKYVKFPHGCEEAAISSNLRSYLLGASPTATIVTTHFENIMNPHTTASVTSQNVVLQKPLVSPTKVLVDSGNVPKWLNRCALIPWAWGCKIMWCRILYNMMTGSGILFPQLTGPTMIM
ncbi:uncharacterized protein LOC141687382 [Apium graveolens]|uniref:uncharacterized protein LOC141687382 n=1 Tax=Apium graveolens TaxID=4045 RepID=UPI003D7A56B1